MLISMRIHSDWHRVGAGFSVSFSLANDHVKVAWIPESPAQEHFRMVQGGYQTARARFLQEVGRLMGCTVVCLEVRE